MTYQRQGSTGYPPVDREFDRLTQELSRAAPVVGMQYLGALPSRPRDGLYFLQVGVAYTNSPQGLYRYDSTAQAWTLMESPTTTGTALIKGDGAGGFVAAVSGTDFVAPSQFTQALAIPGYQGLPSGFITQFGTATSSGTATGNATATFATPFPNACLLALASITGAPSGSPGNYTVVVGTGTKTQLPMTTLLNGTVTGGLGVAYIAIGY